MNIKKTFNSLAHIALAQGLHPIYVYECYLKVTKEESFLRELVIEWRRVKSQYPFCFVESYWKKEFTKNGWSWDAKDS